MVSWRKRLLPFRSLILWGMGPVLLAFAVRAGYLFFLHSLQWPAQWFHTDRVAFIMAMHWFGLPISPALELQLIDLRGAQQEFLLNDPGLIYVFYWLGKLAGAPSFEAVQWVQAALDSLLVLPLAAIGKRMGGERCGRWTAIAYALFLPQIYINAMPHYSAWLTYGFVLSTYLFLGYEQAKGGWRWLRFTAACGVIFIVSFLRSTISFFGLGYALLSALKYLGEKKSSASWKSVGLALLIASAFVGARSKVDFSGQGTPVRSTLAHSLMVGVGQFNNPFGLVEADSSPLEWYYRENPGSEERLRAYRTPTNSPEYNAWLMGKFRSFVADYPLQYAKMVMKRGLMILVPNFKLSIYADVGEYAHVFKIRNDEITSLSRKLYSLSSGLREKATILARIAELESSYIVLLPFRLLFMFLLPIGLLFALWFAPDKLFLLVALSPLLYTLGTVSLVYGPGQVHVSAWAAALPVVVCGWQAFLRDFPRFRRRS